MNAPAPLPQSPKYPWKCVRGVSQRRSSAHRHTRVALQASLCSSCSCFWEFPPSPALVEASCEARGRQAVLTGTGYEGRRAGVDEGKEGWRSL
ncbi:hypothetical protein E2C01_070188 [Portunus trituberculatus]|uniref:Uncharacterized protein n=1 Tax=Portunus trituberculatus TaxID=210409 RepID=A0A5B7HWL6_PORTR|nr:hypothetical protein [Portunus trituberculatus]